MPIQLRAKRPLVVKSGSISLTILMGMAKPMPEPEALMALLMPITSPRMLMSGPPELPGLMDASVCRKL